MPDARGTTAVMMATVLNILPTSSGPTQRLDSDLKHKWEWQENVCCFKSIFIPSLWILREGGGSQYSYKVHAGPDVPWQSGCKIWSTIQCIDEGETSGLMPLEVPRNDRYYSKDDNHIEDATHRCQQGILTGFKSIKCLKIFTLVKLLQIEKGHYTSTKSSHVYHNCIFECVLTLSMYK